MRILIADDDPTSRRLLEASLAREGYEVLMAEDGQEAWDILSEAEPPRLALLDWVMPGLDGVEIVARIRKRGGAPYIYVLLLTTKNRTEDIVSGLEAGADDYLVKPYDPHELRCRVGAGARIVKLESQLEQKMKELRNAVEQVGQLQGLLPICMFCKKIRDDSDTWHALESYIERNSGAMFSHSVCDQCRTEHYPQIPAKR